MKRRERQKRDAPVGPEVHPVKVPDLVAWLEKLKEERPEDLDRIEETLDILADYEAERDTDSLDAEVEQVNPRLLVCAKCRQKVLPGDVCCRGCGRRLVWNLRGGMR